jgi:putative transcriptional regulator
VTVAAGTEALIAARAVDVEPDARFATAAAVREAATKGFDVLLLATADALSAHTDAPRAERRYEVVDAAGE